MFKKRLWTETRYREEEATDIYGVTWSKPEILTLNVFMDHTCESKRSLSAQFSATDGTLSFGMQESLEEIKKFNIVIRDNITDPLYAEKILPFVKRVSR